MSTPLETIPENPAGREGTTTEEDVFASLKKKNAQTVA